MATTPRRMTKQKAAILDYLKHSTHHPDAECVYQELKKQQPDLSRSTVYRNLAQLSEDQVIEKMGLQTESDHYDGNCSPHNHFICKKCGRIFDCGKEEIDTQQVEPIGSIETFTVYFYGVCHDCEKEA
ncbi:MAG: transcriptional repressor [Clostridia bacterium]|nr:transcriptional repressor [Clostridia bacterium]